MADIRFQFEINGQRVCTSGIAGFGVLSATVSYVKRDPARYDEQKRSAPPDWDCTREEWAAESLVIVSTSSAREGTCCWLGRELAIGDEVTIRVLGPGDADPPRSDERL